MSDTHLGYDLPLKPRIPKRRRGADFFANYKTALQPALAKKVNLVIHGGDLFFRSRVHPFVIEQAFEPLLSIADSGIPVYIVPGNHERSNIPQSLLETHPNIKIFSTAKTFLYESGGLFIALAGFPYYRNGIRNKFTEIIKQTDLLITDADFRFLCIHHIVEGAFVGIQHYVFRGGDDVIKSAEIPANIDAVLSGHIHTRQIMKYDAAGRPLAAPVIYPGSTERTSFAEREETKGYFILTLSAAPHTKVTSKTCRFVKLNTRPMIELEIIMNDMPAEKLEQILIAKIKTLDPDGIVRIKPQGKIPNHLLPCFRAAFLRSIAPPTMNINYTLQF